MDYDINDTAPEHKSGISSAARGELEERALALSDDPCVAVILAAAGYPGTPRSGDVITGLDEATAAGCQVLHAGTAADADGAIVTAGGRVLAVAARGADLDAARELAYRGADLITFDGRQMRRAIGS